MVFWTTSEFSLTQNLDAIYVAQIKSKEAENFVENKSHYSLLANLWLFKMHKRGDGGKMISYINYNHCKCDININKISSSFSTHSRWEKLFFCDYCQNMPTTIMKTQPHQHHRSFLSLENKNEKRKLLTQTTKEKSKTHA